MNRYQRRWLIRRVGKQATLHYLIEQSQAPGRPALPPDEWYDKHKPVTVVREGLRITIPAV